MRSFTTAALLAALLTAPSHAFSPPMGSQRKGVAMHAAETTAQALSDYMAKSHEEKLRAMKEVEDKKNAEIQVWRS